MTALKTAAQRVLDAYYAIEPMTAVMEDLRAALAEQQQPVAWQWLDTGVFRKKIPRQATPAHWRPLYTNQHHQPRQPLTDEEIAAFWKAVPNQALYEAVMVFARAIEHAHGIGGQDE